MKARFGPQVSNHYLYLIKLLSRGLQLSCGKLRQKPATRRFDKSFAPIVNFGERFARQHPFGPPSRFPSTSTWSTIAHRLSGRLRAAPSQIYPARSTPDWTMVLSCKFPPDSLSFRDRSFPLYHSPRWDTPWTVFQDGSEKVILCESRQGRVSAVVCRFLLHWGECLHPPPSGGTVTRNCAHPVRVTNHSPRVLPELHPQGSFAICHPEVTLRQYLQTILLSDSLAPRTEEEN